MAHIIIKLRDKYFVWSTSVDAPITYGMTEAALVDFIRERDGQTGLDELPRRLERVAKFGSSSAHNESAQDTIAHNRAGPGERCLTEDELWEAYAYPEPAEISAEDEQPEPVVTLVGKSAGTCGPESMVGKSAGVRLVVPEAEAAQFRSEAQRHVFVDQDDTRGTIVCYKHPDGRILIDEVRL